MRAQIYFIALSFGWSLAAGCETKAELEEIGAREVADFEREAEEGDSLGHRVYDDVPRTAEGEGSAPGREAELGEEEAESK